MRLALLTILIAVVTPCRADVMRLDDGTVLRGEVVEERTNEVEFRAKHDGVWETRTYRRSEIDALFAEDGDQSDRGEKPVERGDPTPAKPPNPDPVRPAAPIGEGAVVVIPLHGQVGGLIDGSIAGTFDAAMVRACLEVAVERRASAVLLEIDSPGGYIAEMEAICETIIDFHDRVRIVAWPKNAISAAAIIAMTCREMVVQPGALIGAAVLVEDGGNGLTAVEAKRASPIHARHRDFMAASERPYSVVAAMTIQDRELYWSDTDGFSSVQPRGGDLLDDDTTVYTMTGNEAVRYRLALAEAATTEDAAAAVGLDGRTVARLDDEVDAYRDELNRELADVMEAFARYFGALNKTYEQSLRAVDAIDAGDEDAAGDARVAAAQATVAATASSLDLRRVDSHLLTGRAQLPDSLKERLVDDSAVLKKIRKLLADGSRPAVDDARRETARMLDRWKDVLGGA